MLHYAGSRPYTLLMIEGIIKLICIGLRIIRMGMDWSIILYKGSYWFNFMLNRYWYNCVGRWCKNIDFEDLSEEGEVSLGGGRYVGVGELFGLVFFNQEE